jgi:hypothetical protein
MALKLTATALSYQARGFPGDRINTHSLHSSVANAVSLVGYSNWENQKVGQWKGATFKE